MDKQQSSNDSSKVGKDDPSSTEPSRTSGSADGDGWTPSGIRVGAGVLDVQNQAIETSVRQFLGKAAEDKEDLQLFAVQPLSWCPHLETVEQVSEAGLNINDPCMECGHVGENWVCLVCYEVHCGRYVKEHMVAHGHEKDHPIVLSYADLSVWCYECDHYVHNEIVLPAKRAAHVNKFGEEPPDM